jgi:hypothetical protein
MPKISSRQFGLIVAFLIPGFIGLAGFAPLMPLVGEWLRPVKVGDFGIGPTIYALLAAMAVGMILSCIRWLVVDHLHQWSGITAPALDFRQLENRLEALDYLSDNHYRYYQFYANTLVAILWAYTVNRLLQTSPLLGIGSDLGAVFLCVVLFLGSRDTLWKYRVRANQLIGQATEKDGEIMTNGLDHHGSGSTSRKDRAAMPQGKPRPETKPTPAAVKGTQPSK